ncbi:hypothetical protein BDW69DRAFT_182227 [Aspergillus filifer]
MISGLKVEYQHTTPGLILGQWIDDSEDSSFELATDESVQSPDRDIQSSWFQTTDFSDEDRNQFREISFFGDVGNALVALAWDLEDSDDDFRGVLEEDTAEAA